MNSPYIRDSIINVHVRAGAEAFAYSDGEKVELALLNIVEQASNRSTVSPELAGAIIDWPTEYHLSSARHNLLRPFDIGPGHTVLELGCGCGAMTRYLGETGATVIAVEGSRRRAQIAASRCRDLPNVAIYCDNLIDFEFAEQFDFVTLIGVLEYAPKFVGGNDPVLAVLDHARSFLKDGGALILAIENQLGLKYFNGCDEDHVGIPYYGINDLYGKSDPVTFGRSELAGKLCGAGLLAQDFFYPFPDYKLPSVILSESALRDSRLNVADLLIHNTGRIYPETHHRAFAEDLAWRAAIRNQLLPDLANSFLVIARPTAGRHCKTDWLAKMYSRGRRHPCYRIESTIERHQDSALIVRKRRLFPDAPGLDKPWLRHVVDANDYLAGNLCIAGIHRAMAREADIDELAACFGPWMQYLSTHATTDDSGARFLPGEFVDCIPANLIETGAGELRYFDAEWVCDTSIPLVWVVVRGIVYSLIDCLENARLRQTTYRQLATRIAQENGLALGVEDFAIADRCEVRLVEQCHADKASTPRLADFLDNPLFLTVRLAHHSPDYRHSLAWHQAELARIKQTISWRVTSPLRIIWNLLRRLVPKNLR